MKSILTVFTLIAAFLSMEPVEAKGEGTSFTRTRDVVYGRKFGTALTMDVFEPKGKANGATIIWVVSGGWFSSHSSIKPDQPLCPIKPLIARGYRVCAVVHGSNPLFSIEDAISDITRAVRFTRHTEKSDGRSSAPVGIIGSSAGGHLSLMAATTGDNGNADADDPVERQPSKVESAACFFPPTDFLNYGDTHINARETTLGQLFVAPFQFKRMNPETKAFEVVTSKPLLSRILTEISPVTHVSPDDAPSLVIHGDADLLVPFQQAEVFIDKMEQAGVEARLVRRPGAAHGWPDLPNDYEILADWMDKHLLQKTD